MKLKHKAITLFFATTAISIGTFYLGRCIVRDGAKHILNFAVDKARKLNAATI